MAVFQIGHALRIVNEERHSHSVGTGQSIDNVDAKIDLHAVVHAVVRHTLMDHITAILQATVGLLAVQTELRQAEHSVDVVLYEGSLVPAVFLDQEQQALDAVQSLRSLLRISLQLLHTALGVLKQGFLRQNRIQLLNLTSDLVKLSLQPLSGTGNIILCLKERMIDGIDLCLGGRHRLVIALHVLRFRTACLCLCHLLTDIGKLVLQLTQFLLQSQTASLRHPSVGLGSIRFLENATQSLALLLFPRILGDLKLHRRQVLTAGRANALSAIDLSVDAHPLTAAIADLGIHKGQILAFLLQSRLLDRHALLNRPHANAQPCDIRCTTELILAIQLVLGHNAIHLQTRFLQIGRQLADFRTLTQPQILAVQTVAFLLQLLLLHPCALEVHP